MAGGKIPELMEGLSEFHIATFDCRMADGKSNKQGDLTNQKMEMMTIQTEVMGK